MPGSSVVFQFYNDLSANTTALTETLDPDAVGVPSTSSVTVTLLEYGNVVLETRKLRLFAISDVDAGVANMVAFNMRDSLDGIVGPVLNGGTNVIRRNSGTLKSNLIAAGAGTTGAIASTDKITSEMFRLGVSKLRGGKVIPRMGELYTVMLHPDISFDLRSETGGAAWRDPHNYQAGDAIWQGNIGVYEGANYVESPRIISATDGASSARVYRNLIFGREALAEAVAEEPGIVIGNVTDKLQRFNPVGWRGTLGWSIFRQAALIRVEAASSIAA
jgi:N4-gp56 family major capsid protein